MPEAVTAVIDYCFNTLNLDFLNSGYFPSNKQLKRVHEKCGFKIYKENLVLKFPDETIITTETILENNRKKTNH